MLSLWIPHCKFFKLCLLVLEPHLAALRSYSSLYTLASLLVGLAGQYGISGIKPGLAIGKAKALLSVLTFWLHHCQSVMYSYLHLVSYVSSGW